MKVCLGSEPETQVWEASKRHRCGKQARELQSLQLFICFENKFVTCQNTGCAQWSFQDLRGSFISIRLGCCLVSYDLDVDCHMM